MRHIIFLFGPHCRESSGSGGAVDVVVLEYGTVGTKAEEIFIVLRCCTPADKPLYSLFILSQAEIGFAMFPPGRAEKGNPSV